MKCINCNRYGVVKGGKPFCWAKEKVIKNQFEEIECDEDHKVNMRMYKIIVDHMDGSWFWADEVIEDCGEEVYKFYMFKKLIKSISSYYFDLEYIGSSYNDYEVYVLTEMDYSV